MSASAVTIDDLFEVMALLGCPTVFLDNDRGAPGEEDIPQLIGAVTAAVERLGVARRIGADHGSRRGWAAGYLAVHGAGGISACGDQQAFDFIALRLRATEDLFEGHHGGLMSGAVIAALAGTVSAAAATSALSEKPGDPSFVREQVA